MSSPSRPAVPSRPAESDRLITLIETARSYAFAPQYLALTRTALQTETRLLETLSAQLIALALQQYSAQFQPDLPAITQVLGEWLTLGFERNQLWDKIAQEVWVNGLAWSVQDLEPSIAASVIESIAQEPYREAIWQTIFAPETVTQTFNLRQLEALICQDLITQILKTPQDLEPLLLGFPIDWAIAEIPIPPLTIYSCLARESGESIPADIADAAAPTSNSHPSPSSLITETVSAPPIALEHYLTRPSELYRLPWELMAQIKQQCGLPMVQLLCLLVGHAMRQPSPAASPFTLTEREILEQLDWNPSAAVPSPPNLAHLLEQLTTLSITTIWMSEPSATHLKAHRTSGHPWEILSVTQGNLDWTTGRVAPPEELTITLRPGLWLPHLIQQGGLSARSAWAAFGQFALTLLEGDHCRDSFLMSLLVPLLLNAPQPYPDARSPSYTVQTLLDAALPTSARHTLQLYPDIGPALFRLWNQTLEALLTLGWSNSSTPAIATPTEFYQLPYPDWLNLDHPGRKPPNWIEQWFVQPLTLVPPADLMGLPPFPAQTDRPAHLAPPRPARRLRFERLTGSQIRTARKAKQLTQSQLADVLHVHQSLIAKIEVGQRTITEALEQSLRQVLEL
jgi:DNA-binding XRE family transcriptional regulator